MGFRKAVGSLMLAGRVYREPQLIPQKRDFGPYEPDLHMEKGGFCGVRSHRNPLVEGVNCQALKLLTEGTEASPHRAAKGMSGLAVAQGGCTHLHAVGEHDTHRHQLGEDLEQLWVGEHAVLQAVVQEAGVVAQDIINVGCL